MADNVFALLAQQEMDRPQRELQQMQALQQKMALRKLMEEQQYNDSMKSYLAAQPQTRDITSLSSIPTPIARDANAPAFDTGEGGLLASLNPMSEQTVKNSQPISLNDRFRQQYDYHMANGRTDKAQEVLDHQVELAGKAAKVVDQMFKAGGQPAVASFLQSNPQYADLVGSYKDLKFSQEGVLHPHTDEQGNIIPGMYWNIGKDGVPVTHKVESTTNKVNPGFQDAIAGLTGMSEQRNEINPQDSPYAHYRVGNTPITSRYAPFSEVEKDIRSAGAQYGATAEDINKAIDDARAMYKDTYVQGQRVKPAGSKSGYTPEYNLLGQQKDVGKTTDVTVKVNNGGGDGLGGMAPEDITHYAQVYNATGNLPSLGMGASSLRSAILKKASQLARGEGKTGGDVAADASDNKAIRGSIVAQEKQIGAMGSFVKNIDKQVTRFEQISKNLSSADSRLLNVPIRELRGRVAGSPLQSKVDMYLTEISSETGKLASGATGSVAELSQGAREKWEKIHDPNLSMADLLDMLKETRHAGQMRMDSVREQLNETKARLRSKPASGKAAPVKIGKYIVEAH